MSVIGELSLWSAAIGCGLMAGVYFTFSTFLMSSLRALGDAQGSAAMQSINRVILRSAFLPLFFVSSALSLGLSIWGIVRWGQPGAMAMVVAGALYVVGMFICTAAGNVPLNNALDRVDASSTEGASVWQRYLRVWTRYNHIRTVCSALSCGLFFAALRAMA